MSKRVVINADDFGIAKGVNRGIAECHLNGVLNSASLMVNMPDTQDAIQISKQLPRLKIGLHISLIGGRPVSKKEEISSIVDKNGFFFKRGVHLIRKLLYTGKRTLGDISKEIRTQIELMQGFGLKIEHLDSHDHIHVFPSIMNIVVQLAEEYKIPRIRWLNQKLIFVSKNPCQYFKSYSLSFLNRCSKYRLNKKKISICEYCWGLAESGNLNKKTLMAILRLLPEGSNEIICHPGYVNEELLQIFPVIYKWEEELKALTSPEVKSLIKDCGIELM